MLLLVAGGDPHRELGVDDRAVKSLAADLYSDARRGDLAAGIDELAVDARDLPRVREAALFLAADIDLAWRLYAARADRGRARRLSPDRANPRTGDEAGRVGCRERGRTCGSDPRSAHDCGGRRCRRRPVAGASQLIDRNASGVRSASTARARRCSRTQAAGKPMHVLAWGAVERDRADARRASSAFQLDYTGGWEKYFLADPASGCSSPSTSKIKRTPGYLDLADREGALGQAGVREELLEELLPRRAAAATTARRSPGW